MEDDCILRDDVLDQLAQHRQQIESATWDVLYLGCHAVRDYPGPSPGTPGTPGDGLIRVLSAFHTHAYAVRRGAIPALVAAIGQRLGMMDGPFDEFRWPGLRKVRFSPTLAIQEPAMVATRI